MAVKEKEVVPKIAQRASRPTEPDTLKPLRSDVQPQPQVITESLPKQRKSNMVTDHWLAICGGMLIMLVLSLVAINIVFPWVTQQYQQVRYGDARISEFDFNVGHNGTSHFLAQYWHEYVIMIEFPQDHPQDSKVYSAKASAIGDSSQHVVTLSIGHTDINEQPGKYDIVASISGFPLPVIFYNTGTGFSTEKPR